MMKTPQYFKFNGRLSVSSFGSLYRAKAIKKAPIKVLVCCRSLKAGICMPAKCISSLRAGIACTKYPCWWVKLSHKI